MDGCMDEGRDGYIGEDRWMGGLVNAWMCKLVWIWKYKCIARYV